MTQGHHDGGYGSSLPGFLRIPREIRQQIYGYLLDDGGQRWLRVYSLPMAKAQELLRHRDAYVTSTAVSSAGVTAMFPWQKAHEQRYVEEREREELARAQHDNLPNHQRQKAPALRRTTYKVLDGSIHRRCYETTYGLNGAAAMHPAVLAVCRVANLEASALLYGAHAFDFGPDVEAVVPFMEDRAPGTRALVRHISVAKAAPMPSFGSDRYEWARFCRWLGKAGVRAARLAHLGEGAAGSGLLGLTDGHAVPAAVAAAAMAAATGGAWDGDDVDSEDEERGDNNEDAAAAFALEAARRQRDREGRHISSLRLVVEGGRPREPWYGPATMTYDNLAFLAGARHESIDWVNDLVEVLPGLDKLDVVADLRYCPPPTTTHGVIFAAFSASIETSLREFLTAKKNAGKREAVQAQAVEV